MVEDQTSQQVAIVAALEARRYRVRVADTGRAAMDVATSREPDVVLLDLGLPDIDGLELCRRMRAVLSCPIIVVTADLDEDRVVAALDTGADDYVRKPFSMRELLARLRVAIRHRATFAAGINDDELLRCGDLVIDVAGHRAMAGGAHIDLQPRPFAALALLVRNEGTVVTYARLNAALGGATGANGLRIMMSRLRKLLGTGPHRPEILTEPRVGYRLVRPD